MRGFQPARVGPAWWLGWVLVLGVGVWLRTTQLGHQILLDDEWHALHKLMDADYREIFLSFGYADHSIPLTLLFKFLSETVGLSEWRMRALPLLFGIMSLLLLPWLLKPWLGRRETLVLGALLAVSPLLVFFSRYVRPYSITVLLGFVAVIALWRWWHDRDRRWLLAFVPATILAAWLHPLSLLFTGGALSWFGWMALYQWWRERRMEALARLLPVALISALPTALLVLPPLLADPTAMSGKTGIHQLQFDTALRAWELVVGTASWWLAGPLLILTLIGAAVLFRRDRGFLAYWLYLVMLALVVIALLSPAWIHFALVPVRYLSIALPWVLALIALGLIHGFDRMTRRWAEPARQPVTLLALGLVLSLLLVSGPLPRSYDGLNQFTNSMSYQFDYDFSRNPFVQVAQAAPMPAVYRRMADEPGDWLLIESPWHFEAHFSPLWAWQRQHRLPIRIGMISGWCAPWTPGELRVLEHQRLRLRQFVPLSDLPWVLADRNRFVVFHRKPPMPGEVRELPDLDECHAGLLQRLGEPWHQDEMRTIFRLERGWGTDPAAVSGSLNRDS